MKSKKEDKALRELFAKKLGNAEFSPDPAVRDRLMSELGRKEFLHFIPGKFNIWYTGIITVAAAALTILVFSHKKSNSAFVQPVVNELITIKESDGAGNAVVIDNFAQDQETDKQIAVKNQPAAGRKPSTDLQNESAAANLTPAAANSTTINPGAIKTITGDNILKGGVETGRLQESPASLENPVVVSLTEGCIPFKVDFRSAIVPVDSCLWTFGDGGSSTDDKTEWLFDQPGEFKVTLQVYSKNELHSGSVIIKAHPAPDALFEIRPEDAVLPQDEIRFMNYSADGVKFRWDFGDGQSSEKFEPVHTYIRSGKYDISLVVSSMFGCTDTMTIKNAFGASKYFLEFPNAFIPNVNGPSGGYYSSSSDQEASVFHPVFSGVTEYQLRIFSRRGILIFESNDINIGWDGYYRNQLSENGVYIWKVRGTFLNGETFTKMGDVTLLKK